MATVTAFIRTSKKETQKVKIRFRLRDGRDVQLFHVSRLEVSPLIWDPKTQSLKAKLNINDSVRADFNKSISSYKDTLLRVYAKIDDKKNLTSEQFDKEIDKVLNPKKYGISEYDKTFFEYFDVFLKRNNISDHRIAALKVVKRMLQRFELYKRIETPSFKLTFDTVTPSLLNEFDAYLKTEHILYEKHFDILRVIPESRKPEPRGHNTIVGVLVKVRSFILWANKMEFTTTNAFSKYSIPEASYGTPYYITIEERNKLYKTNLSRHPHLAVQRDIFIFQCLIGCRVGDLLKMTKENVINGAIEYIASKTKEGRPVTVRVPLNATALEILERYKECGDKLLPFISSQKYNDAIKVMFRAARLNRKVTILNPTTGKSEVRPLNEIASSHLARRTFIGNLYKKVKDPNLVGSLSGHKEGSKAFARYRDIDEDMKKELVDMLE